MDSIAIVLFMNSIGLDVLNSTALYAREHWFAIGFYWPMAMLYYILMRKAGWGIVQSYFICLVWPALVFAYALVYRR